jgi:hypothetical protein
MGPTIIFDKSTFQSLTVDEAVLLDALYQSNITPLFFVEVLADLSLREADRSPASIVRDLAKKTPELSPAVNAHHRTLAIAGLHGNEITMDGRPVVLSAEPARSHEGHVGWHMDVSPEQRAFQRWQRGQFNEAEHGYARNWRTGLSGIDLRAIHARYRPIVLGATPRPKDLDAIKTLAERLTLDPHPLGLPDPLLLAFSMIGVPVDQWRVLSRFWRSRGEPPLREFAPYTWHIVVVDLFFNLAIGAELIGRERPSNKIDIGYLYYLPFCHLFSSRDRLHRRVAQLFLRTDQSFVGGDDLKADLHRLNEHYTGFSEEEKERGLINFAKHPPIEGDFLTSQMWDQHLPGWRRIASAPAKMRSRESDRRAVNDISSIMPVRDGSVHPDSLDTDSAAFLKIIRHYPVRKGKWRVLPDSAIPHKTERDR